MIVSGPIEPIALVKFLTVEVVVKRLEESVTRSFSKSISSEPNAEKVLNCSRDTDSSIVLI
jgi:hypothetical protein